MTKQFITVEGNIGAGKTTLSKMLAEHFKANLILEQFADNPFLPKFYKDKEKYAFQLELSFLADRFKQLKKMLLGRDLFSSTTISDYLFIKSKIFAKVNLPQDEYELYESLFDIIYPNLPKPDLLIFLHAPVHKLKKNISARNRSYEQEIADEYLITIEKAYNNYLKSAPCPVLMIDTRETDFMNNEIQFNELLIHLDREYENGKHFISFSDLSY